MQQLLKLTVLIIFLSSCNTYKTKYPYSLNDFRPELRKHLEKILEKGGTCFDYESTEESSNAKIRSYLSNHTTVADLQKLIKCEHPLLRAYSFNILCERDDFNIDNTLLNNLDDTATITYCRGEWGENFISVSDYYIYASKGHTTISEKFFKNKIIKDNNYLESAYDFIARLDSAQEEYYLIIKNMAHKDNSNERKINSLEALSKYKKQEDIPFIATELFNSWRAQNLYYPFKLIEENPDTAYFKILEKFHRIISRGETREERQLKFYLSSGKLDVKYESFLNALVAYKNIKSSKIIADILNKEIYPLESTGGVNYRYTIYKLLVENKCSAYNDLIAILEPEVTKIEKKIIRIDTESMPPVDIPWNGYW